VFFFFSQWVTCSSFIHGRSVGLLPQVLVHMFNVTIIHVIESKTSALLLFSFFPFIYMSHVILRYDLHNNITIDGPQQLLDTLYTYFKTRENINGIHHVEKSPEYLWPPRTLLIRLTHSPRMGEMTLAPLLDILHERGYRVLSVAAYEERETYVLRKEQAIEVEVVDVPI